MSEKEMSTVERIRELLDCTVTAQVRDAAGVIIPAGWDAQIEAKAYKRCLKIAQEEEKTCYQLKD